MKKYIKVFLLFALIVPVFISASSSDYASAVDKANNYYKKVDTEGKFFRNDSLPYSYKNKKVSSDGSLKTGGFLNILEYKISKSNTINGKQVPSYLSPGVEFWLTAEGTTYRKLNTDVVSASKDDSTESRVAKYLKYTVRSSGTGSANDPWVFEDVFRVSIEVKNQIGGNITSDKVKFVSKGKAVEFTYSPTAGYQYANIECEGYNGTAQNANSKITLIGITSNVSCRILFEKVSGAAVTYRYFKESYDSDNYIEYKTEVLSKKEGEKVSIPFKTPNQVDSSDKEEYVINKDKGKYTGYATLDPKHPLELSVYYDLTNIVEVKANTTGVKDAESGEQVKFKVSVKNNKTKAVTVYLKDEVLATYYKNNKIINPDSTLQSILSTTGYIVNLGSNEEKSFEYSFTVNEVPGKSLKSKLTYSVNNKTPRSTNEVNLGIEKAIAIEEINEKNKSANIVLVLDVSGSMNSASKGTAAKAAMQEFIGKAFPANSVLNSNNRIKVATFGTKAGDVAGLAQDYASAETLKTNVGNIKISGNTCYKCGLDKAKEVLFTGSGNLHSAYPNNENFVIFLSDGSPTDGDAYKNAAPDLKNAGATIYTIAYGNPGTAATNRLKDIASKPENMINASTNNITEIFNDLYSKVTNPVPMKTTGRYVQINKDAIVNSTYPLELVAGGVLIKSFTSLDTAVSQGYAKKTNGIYYIDATKFNAADKIIVKYHMPN